jgi:alkylated DNA repair dioxygenase AlkB
VQGADALFTELVEVAPWAQRRRHMYDRIVDEPRLTAWYGDGLVDESLPGAVREMAAALSARYERTFDGVGAALYRDGRDSVAWHGDTFGRGSTEDTMVAIVSVGAPRALLLRPKGGGSAVRHALGHGDLLVMGGSCQRSWEHAVPKTAKPVGPRISVQFRPRDVR